MPRKSSQKNRTKARKAKQKATAPKRRHKHIGSIGHYHPSGLGFALLAASVMRMRREKDT